METRSGKINDKFHSPIVEKTKKLAEKQRPLTVDDRRAILGKVFFRRNHLAHDERNRAPHRRSYLKITIFATDEGFAHVKWEMRMSRRVLQTSARKQSTGWKLTIEALFTKRELEEFSLDLQLFMEMGYVARQFSGSLGPRNISVAHH